MNIFYDGQADIIDAFNSTSRYLDDLLNIDNLYFEGMVNHIYKATTQNKREIGRVHNYGLYSTGSETFISFTLTNVKFRKSRDFLRGFCEEVAWVLREISVSFAKFCESFFVERGKQA